MKGKRALKWVGIAIGIVAVLLLGLALVNWNALRGPIARYASAKAGRPVLIKGDLDVRLLSFSPTIRVKGLEIGNPRWAGEGAMARVDELSAKVRLPGLFVG